MKYEIKWEAGGLSEDFYMEATAIIHDTSGQGAIESIQDIVDEAGGRITALREIGED